MTQEYKELLLKDLCARLPYGLLVKTPDHFNPQVVDGINNKLEVIVQNNLCYSLLFEVKPYLRPMSSMTEEEQKEFVSFHCVNLCPIVMNICLTIDNESKMLDWLNAHHFDYRGLIEKGLALEVTEENNPYNPYKK